MIAMPQVEYADPNSLYNYVLERLPVRLPTHTIGDDVDLKSISTDALASLSTLVEGDFAEQPIWRDSMALTGTFRTFYSAPNICQAWKEMCRLRACASFKLDVVPPVVTRVPGNVACWVTVSFTFESNELPQTQNWGSLALVPTPEGVWRIWMIATVLAQLKRHPSVDYLQPSATEARPDPADLSPEGPQDFDAVVVGAGQAGLSVAGRLKALNVSYLVIDSMQKIGDNWRLRYDSTRLHTTREFAHLPFERTFTPDYQEYLTKDDVAKGFGRWFEKYDINAWLSTTLESGRWDPQRAQYELTVKQAGRTVKVSCRHVVMATGGYGTKMLYPQYENRGDFKGVVLHSEQYKSSSQWPGKSGVVVGSANTAHDIAADMVRAGLKTIHLVQRERTFVIPGTHFKIFADELYNAHTPTEVADRISYSQPWAVSRLYNRAVLHPLAARETERYEALEKVRFRVTQYGDLVYNLSVRRGGHYMDVGCSDLISRGLIKVQSGALPVRYTPNGLVCSDGAHLPADVIVFATGFTGSLNDRIADKFGQEVADNFGTFWGLDDEGEIRGAFKPTGQPGMWAAAGTLGHCRWYSRFIALHIRAQVDGNPIPVYNRLEGM